MAFSLASRSDPASRQPSQSQPRADDADPTLTGISMTTQQTLFLPGKERQDDRSLEPDPLAPDRPGQTQQVSGTRPIVVPARRPDPAERSSGIVMRRHDRHALFRRVRADAGVGTDHVGGEPGEEGFERAFRPGGLDGLFDPTGGLTSSTGERMSGD